MCNNFYLHFLQGQPNEYSLYALYTYRIYYVDAGVLFGQYTIFYYNSLIL